MRRDGMGPRFQYRWSGQPVRPRSMPLSPKRRFRAASSTCCDKAATSSPKGPQAYRHGAQGHLPSLWTPSPLGPRSLFSRRGHGVGKPGDRPDLAALCCTCQNGHGGGGLGVLFNLLHLRVSPGSLVRYPYLLTCTSSFMTPPFRSSRHALAR